MDEAGKHEARSGEAQLTMLVAALNALPMAEFLDVMRQVLPVQAANNADPAFRNDLMIVEVSTDQYDGEVDERLVAWPDRDRNGGGLGVYQGLWEEGTCSGCLSTVTSSAKRAICPRCGAPCGLT
ncbi:hypothetical protein GCM10010112_13320 [Actinoplanes lobatus]|uniref:Uncharacterized protein n=1 Tax=Actinoplanes lobatus TaxID=113568 RepID=A0A7W7MK60_9ACTN|nr:hypothetical protein [Actinoplanes lobatus]MBB4753168.1 hypothetical protein [Actinoplanes lobatus]GGN58972.1 hypothetical protein GCM10010112_13320 [Actinoplanes lobatus]GIE42971.1 hypothetical protein Alo02nite_58690 [Actinoplanes lobatus]